MTYLELSLAMTFWVLRQYYRLPGGPLEMAKVSRVLIALKQGGQSDFKVMSLDEIQMMCNI